MSRPVAIDVSHLGKTYDKVRAVGTCRFRSILGNFRLLGPERRRQEYHPSHSDHPAQSDLRLGPHFGLDSVTDADRVRQTIGYVPQERAIDRFLTGREHLELLADLYHLSPEVAATRIPQLLKLVELEQQADRPAKTYSGGMKQLDIACGLLPDPKVLFLDEPTLGLDVQSRLRIWDHVRAMRERGITVVMTTNYLDEADRLCDRIAIIDGED